MLLTMAYRYLHDIFTQDNIQFIREIIIYFPVTLYSLLYTRRIDRSFTVNISKRKDTPKAYKRTSRYPIFHPCSQISLFCCARRLGCSTGPGQFQLRSVHPQGTSCLTTCYMNSLAPLPQVLEDLSVRSWFLQVAKNYKIWALANSMLHSCLNEDAHLGNKAG